MDEAVVWPPLLVGDRVVLVAEAEHGAIPGRAGVVIDTSAVDADGRDMAAVDFPWSPSYVVVPVIALELVDRPVNPDLPDAVRKSAADLGRQLAASSAGILGGIIAAQAGDDMTDPDIGKHQFTGRSDRPCELPGCGKPDRNPIHSVTPPYRLVYLEDVLPDDEVFYQETVGRWIRCTVLERRDAHDAAHLIVRDPDGDQRGMSGSLSATVPVPL